MANGGMRAGDAVQLPVIQQSAAPTVADQVFDALKKSILTLELPPGIRISETEVAKLMGVSRQPVREAFKRLSKLGFLLIRPQSSTTVSLISEEAVLRARFIRTALEVKTCRTACSTISMGGMKVLEELVQDQKDAVSSEDRELFHLLDDRFHKEICNQAGVGYVWDLIHDNKSHMDRIRMLSLNPSSLRHALDEHIAILDAISATDPDSAEQAMESHLSRILVLIEEVRQQDHRWFSDTTY
ncbi:GntR family transcriptional regulator [Flavimaricola marinus]|uniref:Putative HTH-type transcriptional regulator YdfH n=1 Tax=Flavimaricola marinus TaxID=1819565 RepID=A0A238LHR5_9RHOB|nr:GntR family transcriptional regulator [Flavimaricola marinus]SMY08944.1 putative HTH-type transcriptional regulator YdfH [Flavimaricola marinus]